MKNPNAPAVKREAEEDWDKNGGDWRIYDGLLGKKKL
jgi:hypothetical protein